MTDNVRVRALRTDDWPVVEALFGSRGACGGCWCMWWRVPRGGRDWEAAKGDGNRRAFRQLVSEGRVHAVLAFAGTEPVGWCSFGPRRTFPRLQRSRVLRRDGADEVWSIVCFYVLRAWRARGVGGRLLDGAVAEALRLGAEELEGFPVAPKSAARPVPAAFAWTGVPALFESRGFTPIERPAGSRPIVVRHR